MRVTFAAALVLATSLAGVVAQATTEQRIEPLNPGVQQQVQPMGPVAEQRVEAMGMGEEQRIGAHVPPTESQKAASTAGKVVLGVTAAVVALGAMAASLLFL